MWYIWSILKSYRLVYRQASHGCLYCLFNPHPPLKLLFIVAEPILQQVTLHPRTGCLLYGVVAYLASPRTVVPGLSQSWYYCHHQVHLAFTTYERRPAPCSSAITNLNILSPCGLYVQVMPGFYTRDEEEDGVWDRIFLVSHDWYSLSPLEGYDIESGLV